jgi:hypothetical protein
MKRHIAILLATLIPLSLAATAQQAPPSWDTWKFLLGDWVSDDGGGQPGRASGGSATFKLDLQGRVLVRTDHSEYPATKDRPALAHDGLMIIYADTDGRTRADYWDNEGHVLHYAATADGKTATFLSDQVSKQPRYRLAYTQTAPGAVTVRFEIAPPDKPEQFQVYVEGKTRRKGQ